MASKTPSKTIEEFLQRHPEVQTGKEAKAKLDAIHDIGDTYCVEAKIFDNTILHQDYDADSNKRVIAFAEVNDPKALEFFDKHKVDDGATCYCKVRDEEGAEHNLNDHMNATVPDCKVHKGDDAPNPDCSDCWPIMSLGKCRN